MRFKSLAGPQFLDKLATAENPRIIFFCTRLFQHPPGYPPPAAKLFAFSQCYPVGNKLPILHSRLALPLAEKGQNLVHYLIFHYAFPQDD